MQEIIKISGQLRKILPMELYAAWDHNKNMWVRILGTHCKLVPGVWASQEELIGDLKEEKIDNYKIITVDFSDKIPQDIIRIMNFKQGWDPREKERLIVAKFRQLIETFLFRDKNLKEKLEEEPNGLRSNMLPAHKCEGTS